MSRPIRIEFAHALYHVTARGDRREDIFEDDQDRQVFLSTLGQVITRFNWLCHAGCLMDIRTNNSPIILKCTSPRLGKLSGAPGNGYPF